MHYVFQLALLALTVSARCTRRQATGIQSSGLSPGLNGLAQLPADSNQSTQSSGLSPGLNGLAQLPAGSDTGPTFAKPNSKLAQLPAGSPKLNLTMSGGLGQGGATSGASGCPPAMKAVAFNSGMNAGMFDTIGAADDWLTFSCSIPGGPASPHATDGFIPMMAFEKDVKEAIDLINGPNPPEWMLTFNEPDFSYMDMTPVMNGAQAATAIQPLIEAAKGKSTKFVAPVTADPDNPFLEEFFAACNCKDFFSAYNIHQYNPDSSVVNSKVQAYHDKWNDKPLWITEVAPGGSGCTTSWEQAGQFMKDIYKFSKDSGFVDRVFWNTGNQIDPNDHNVCNSYLLDMAGNPSPLLDMFRAIDCS